jgi:hypothetical protein
MPSQKSRSAFVAMPFAKRFDDLYRQGIARAAFDVNLALVRLGELPIDRVVPEMNSAIHRCDFIIAVATDRNPHVFFEIGLAYAACKAGVIIAEHESDYEIFPKAYSCLCYGPDLETLRERLREQFERLMHPGPQHHI